MVLTDMKDQFVKQSLSTLYISIHALTVFQIGILFLVVVEIAER